MKIKHGLLLSILTVLPIDSPSASEFTVTGMIYGTTCAINDDSDGTIVLPDVNLSSVKTDYGTVVATKEISISCADPDAVRGVTGRFTTNGEVDPTTGALKNLITDASGAKDVGVQIFDADRSQVIVPNASWSAEDLPMDAGAARLTFGLAYVNLGAAGLGDVRVETTFVATYY